MSSTVNKKYEIDMCNGPLFRKICLFYFPLMLSTVLQLLFNAADVVIVGRYAGNQALAAVGSTSSLINLTINLFIGLTVGTNVLVARYIGAKDDEKVSGVVHTSICFAILGGILLIGIGNILARPALGWMDTPADVIDMSVLYMRIYFLGMPTLLLYNYGSAILRAVGDTRRPMVYLIIAGALNVVLNLIFVITFNMSVAGVAIATIVSQALSAILILRCLIEDEGAYKLSLGKLKIEGKHFLEMMKLGLPAGIQGSLFNISNVIIQSSVNSFGSIAVAGNTIASNIEGFGSAVMNACHHCAVSFIGQNHGAGNYRRIRLVCFELLVMVLVVGLIAGNLLFYFGPELIGLYSPDIKVLEFGMKRLGIMATTFFLCGLMDVCVGCLRGMGNSILPMFVSLTGACLFRIVYIFTVFKQNHTLECLYTSYPISWGLTFAVQLICFCIVYGKYVKKIKAA